jgi:hypothetical protein
MLISKVNLLVPLRLSGQKKINIRKLPQRHEDTKKKNNYITFSSTPG